MSRKNSAKERILETASRLFYQQGFNSTGINQIIAEAGIAIGSLYKHYQSKNDLLYHYLLEQEKEYFINLDSYLENEEQPLEKLYKLIDYCIKYQQEAGYSGCHFIKINSEIGREDERITQLVVEHKMKQRAFIHALVDKIDQTQKLTMEKDSLVNTIFLMIEGSVVSANIHGNTDDLKAVKEIISQLF